MATGAEYLHNLRYSLPRCEVLEFIDELAQLAQNNPTLVCLGEKGFPGGWRFSEQDWAAKLSDRINVGGRHVRITVTSTYNGNTLVSGYG
jgi:hypothetical protein